MRFNKHSELQGLHAFLSPSQYHWIRYSDEKLEDRFLNAMNAKRGTELHEFAKEAIRLKVKLQGRNTLAMYVNDAIGYRMTPEQMLFYSPHAFGTTDAISFQIRKKLLRIFDLKNGVTKVSFDQLLVYCALFCLEYQYKPFELEYDLRIYQSDEILTYEVDPTEVLLIMDRIVTFSNRLDQLTQEVNL